MELTEEQIKKAFSETVDEMLKEKISKQIGADVAVAVKTQVEKMRLDRALFGRDISGLTEDKKLEFCKGVSAIGFGRSVEKANEALIEQQDNRGGYLVSIELAQAILRIAASVGTILSQAQKWTMKTDQLGIPNYTGSFLTGGYLGVDVAGVITGLTFGQATLIAQKWQLAFAVGNDLLADASVNLADWLLAIAGEALANMIDQQGFVGSSGNTANSVVVGGPFVGILGNSAVPTVQLATGKTKFSNTNDTTPDGYQVLVDSSTMVGQLEESILDGAAFYIHRTVWAAWRVQKDAAGNYILPYSGWAAPAPMAENEKGGGPVRPAGYIMSYPVYTNRWLPTLPASNGASTSTNFGIFGNMKAMAFGDRGGMSMEKFVAGTFGGKEIALSDQQGIVYKHRHALVIALPKAFVQIETAAS